MTVEEACSRFIISTHTPLAGRDCTNWVKMSRLYNFYSHAPRGA